MKRKYFLRGAGLGVLITSLIFILLKQQPLSEEEVIQMAKELGYVKEEQTQTSTIDIGKLLAKETQTPIESNTNSNIELENTDNSQNTDTEYNDNSNDIDTSDLNSDKINNSELPQITDIPENSEDFNFNSEQESNANDITITEEEIKVSPSDNKKQEEPEKIRLSFEIEYGTNLAKICQNLETAGIVNDAKSFQTYLAENQLDYKIKAGSYVVFSNMDYEELANILCHIKN